RRAEGILARLSVEDFAIVPPSVRVISNTGSTASSRGAVRGAMSNTGDEISRMLGEIEQTPQLRAELLRVLTKCMDLRANRFHPLVFIHGDPLIGEGVYVGLFSEINAKGGRVEIGRSCDIASFVSINVADSHRKTLGLADEIVRGEIVLGESV